MTVAELIEELKQQDPNRLVVMSKDAEGNSYSPLSALYIAAYCPDTTWSGQIGLEKLDDAYRAEGYTEEDVVDGQPALVLYPIN